MHALSINLGKRHNEMSMLPLNQCHIWEWDNETNALPLKSISKFGTWQWNEYTHDKI